MPSVDEHAASIRAFNRFYTRRIGALGGHLESDFSLTETRVLYELATRDGTAASEIARELGLDRGYLSRTLRAFRRRGLITAVAAPEDRRRTVLRLTVAGRRAFAPIDKRATHAVSGFLEPLSDADRKRLVDAMQTIRALLGDPAIPSRRAEGFVLRPPRPGDMGWIVNRHGVLYTQEYGWDERFEALVARVVADFVDHFDPKRERCWIAERNGEPVGSIFVVKGSKTVAKLRLLLLEPSARGLGIGRRLVDEVLHFARQAGYKKVRLWTQSNLKAARRIYKAAGFALAGTEEHRMFGEPLVAETWELNL